MRKKFKIVVFISLLFCSSLCFADDLSDLLKQSSLTKQLVFIVAEDQQATEGILQRYERKDSSSNWQKVGVPLVVTLGKNGIAWDENLPKSIRQNDPIKQEGDFHSPAGIFAIGDVFATDQIKTNMPFIKLQEDTVCVDDDKSVYYNQIINSNLVKKDWNSAERMHGYPEYERGILVRYNTARRKHAGSCIFMHIKYKIVTVGCTSMSKENLSTLIAWLNAESHPVLVQVSQGKLKRLQPLLQKYFQFG